MFIAGKVGWDAALRLALEQLAPQFGNPAGIHHWRVAGFRPLLDVAR